MTKAKHDPRFRGLSGLVRADASDASKLIVQLNKAFEEFKDKHSKDFEDVVRSDEVNRINAAITDLNNELKTVNAAVAAAKIGGLGGDIDPAVAEHAQAFNRFFRKGVDNGLTDLEVKAKLTTQSDPDGGYLVPEEMESTIDRVLGTVSSIRSVSRVINISTDSYKKLVNQGGAGSGWVGETQARPETNTPTLAEITINAQELYANPASTQKALDDAAIDIAQWLADEVGIVFAEQEGAAFATGDGVNKPRGIFSYTPVANASYAWGKIGFIGTGASGAFPTASTSVNPADPLISLYYGLRAGYRNNASWVMSDATMETVRQLKDVEGKYVWSAPTEQGEVATILRKPVVSDDNCPAIGANTFPIAFGDFNRGYLIVDRVGIRVLRDPYTNKPNVHFYTTKRTGGGVVNFEAIKLLKMA